MRRTIYALAVLVCFQCCLLAQDFTRAELGIESSTLFSNRLTKRTDSGAGGRFTYNFGPSLAFETAATYFPTNSSDRTFQDGGTAVSIFAGIKAGIRKRRFGVFFKARPGILSLRNVVTSTATPSDLTTARKTHAALDTGGVLEFYPSARTILSLDAGGTLVRYGDAILFSSPGLIIRSSGSIRNPFNLTFSAGYRIGEVQQRQENVSAASRLQFGFQYSLQTLQRSDSVVRDESSLGGFLTYNLTSHFSLDAAAHFFPREDHFVDFQEGGQMIQVLAGIR